MQLAVEEVLLEPQRSQSGLSFLFAAGDRPDRTAIESILEAPERAGPSARISHRPREDEGWLELLATGLTFELHGLAPARSAPVAAPEHRFGIAPELSPAGLEAVALVPGPHIAGGSGLLPVVRAITGLGAGLALLLPVRAVGWEPAASWMAPDYFARIIVSWLAGGPFPALGLTALDALPEGGVRSAGLAFFSGQEIRVNAPAGEPPAETAKLAMRVIDYIARNGAVEAFTELDSRAGEVICAEPSRDGRLVSVWRTR